jgi:hypothetical protein
MIKYAKYLKTINSFDNPVLDPRNPRETVVNDIFKKTKKLKKKVVKDLPKE